MSKGVEEYAKERAARLREEVASCSNCGDDGWCEPIGPCRDGSYITSRPCVNRCAEKISDAVRFETGKW